MSVLKLENDTVNVFLPNTATTYDTRREKLDKIMKLKYKH